MKLNKKFIALACMCLCGVALVGCNKTSEVPKDNTNSSIVETEKTNEDNNKENEENKTDKEAQNKTDADIEDKTEGQEEVTKGNNAKSLYDTLVEGLELAPSGELDNTMLSDMYQLDVQLVDSYYVAIPMMNVHADELAIFEVSNDESKQAVKDAIAFRQESLIKTWESYLPEQLEAVQNSTIVEKENYILYTIGSNSDEIVERFNNSINNK